MIENTGLHQIFVPFANLFKKLSLHYILIIPFVLQILVIVGVIGWLSLRSGKQAVSELSAQLRSEITDRIEDRLQTYLAIPPIVNQINMNAIRSGMLDLQDETSVEKYLFGQLQAFPLITFSLWGEESKRYFCAMRQKNGASQILRMNESSGENLNFYATDHLGKHTALLRSVRIGDPRNRPWYQAAKKAGKPTWTKIYPSNASQDLSITAVSPVHDTSGNLLGVLGTAFQFRHVSTFLRHLQISQNGLIFLMEDSGELITTSAHETGFDITDGKVVRIKAAESRNRVIRLAGKHLEKHFANLRQIHGAQQSHFDIDGERHFLHISVLEFHENVNFLIVIIMPEADLMAQIRKNTRTTILLCLTALAMAIFVGVLTARWVIRPISSLNASAKEIAKGRWDKTIHIRRSGELGELAKSFNKMAVQIQDMFDNLEKKVRDRTAELNHSNKQLQQAKEKADAANLAKSAFLASMNHELRTPMNAILGFSQLLSRDPGLSPEHQKHLSIIRRSGGHLLTLINDVLDMSKIEAGRTTLNENSFDLHRLLDDLEDMLGLRAKKKGLSLLVEHGSDVPQYVRSDETKLRQILINLIGNAIKFTDQGGVTMRIRKNPILSEVPEVCSLCFEIEDTGPGIAPEETDRLFEAFAQTKTGRQAQEGTGLGLAISRRFVKLMGGDISARSQVGKGTAFFFDIRAHAADAADAENPAASRQFIGTEPGHPRHKILITDDNSDNRRLLFKLLEPFGFELREAANGQEAIDVWQKWLPDLIWMDIRMPVMDGYEAVRNIREMEKKDPKRPRSLIIAQTASTYEEERALVSEAGCDDFLRKPFRESDIFELMHRHMGVRFICEDAETEREQQREHGRKPAQITSEDLSGIPDDLLQRLRQAALATDMENVDGIVAEIRAINTNLADELAVLTDEFEYGNIVRIIRETESAGEETDD